CDFKPRGPRQTSFQRWTQVNLLGGNWCRRRRSVFFVEPRYRGTRLFVGVHPDEFRWLLWKGQPSSQKAKDFCSFGQTAGYSISIGKPTRGAASIRPMMVLASCNESELFLELASGAGFRPFAV